MKIHTVRFIFFAIIILLLIIFLLSINIECQIIDVFTNADSSTAFTVILDAGHGGEDGGAVAPDNTYEKHINLDIALKLEKILKLYGFNVIMTRTQDVMTCNDGLTTQREKKISDIRNRFQIITENKNAIFVSIHQNKFHDETQSGAQMFYSGNNLQSKVLADSIQKSVVSNLQKNNKRVSKKAGTDIFLLYHSPIPSVLVECGFLSNTNDLKLLKTEEYRLKMAILIADGILKYYSNG